MFFIKLTICESILALKQEFRPGRVAVDDIRYYKEHTDGVVAVYFKGLETPVHVSETLKEIDKLIMSARK